MSGSSKKKSAGPLTGLGFLLMMFLVLPAKNLQAKEKWLISTSFSYGTGKYIYDAAVENYTFYAGGHYIKDELSLSLTIPFSMQRDNLQTEANSMMSKRDYSISRGIPGVYLFGEYNIYPSFYLNGQIKIPTTASVTLFSSGEFDFGFAMAYRKMFGLYKIFVDGGYMILGDPQQITYHNPLVYGIGVARYAEDGKSAVSFYYQGYQSIITGLDPPRQLSAAYYRSITDRLGISFYGSKGFSESTADFTLALGFDLAI